MKILNKLTLKNLKLNKARTAVTIIGIMLSTALICVVAGMATSARQTMITAETNWSGEYDVVLTGSTSEKADEIRANRNVNAVYTAQTLGCAMIPEPKNDAHPYIDVKALDKSAFTNCFYITLAKGRFPEKSDEIVISQSVIANSDKKFSLGEQITLDVGKRTDGNGNYIPSKFEYEAYEHKGEALTDTQHKTYTIVGIIDECYNSDICMSDNSACSTVLTVTGGEITAESAEEPIFFVDYLPDSEKNYLEVTSQITGLSDEDLSTAIYDGMSGEMQEKCGFSSIDVNFSVLRLKGYAVGDDTVNMLFSLAAIIIVIVILASVFVIRNSFAISLTEKTKLYGMLASVGTTRKQIRHNVVFEGFVLGAVGILSGLILGISVIGILVVLLNVLIGDLINGAEFVFGVPVWVLWAAALLSIVTILVSALSISFRASRISPVTAIRANNDIKTGKKKKAYKSPRLIKKLFGMGGVIAYKNLKRSRKKYRTTVISIVVSVALFISISSFMDYGMTFADHYYGDYNFNLSVESDVSSKSLFTEWKNQTKEINSLGGIEASITTYSNYNNSLVCNMEFSDKYNEYKNSDSYDELTYEESGKKVFDMTICTFDDATYRRFLQELSLDYDYAKDKAVLYNAFYYKDDKGRTSTGELFKDDNTTDYEYFSSDKDGDSVEHTIKNAGSFTEIPEWYDSYLDCNCLIVSPEWFENNTVFGVDNVSSSIMIRAENADVLEQDIYDLGYTQISVYNVESIVKQFNSMMLMLSIFIYGFIGVITLIGVTNIFNTISTNMRLRSKEFAMLKSVGMTKKEFNRMIRLESLFYGIKSLLIGIPLGILGGIAIFYAFGEGSVLMTFIIPWKAILISIVFVFVIVWLIMKYSVSKVGKQNIIETIRNDNI